MNKLISLIGAPTDIGAGSRGASMGPEALRVANIVSVLESHGLDVLDRGKGMTEAVLTNALVPFYSTKRSGTGLGLALTREIIEAHGGRIALSNREGGGLIVSITLPA